MSEFSHSPSSRGSVGGGASTLSAARGRRRAEWGKPDAVHWSAQWPRGSWRESLGRMRSADFDPSGAERKNQAARAPITPEGDLERQLLDDRDIRAGLDWGEPRPGHPEAKVAAHVAGMLALIDADDPVRQELHDEPYWLWRHHRDRDDALNRLLERLPDVSLFARFVELDAANEGKDLSFLWWFQRELAKRRLLPARHPIRITHEADAPDVVYVKTFAVRPEEQELVANALRELVEEHAAELEADGQVLVSDDRLRVLLTWRWRGSGAARLNRDGDVVRQALAEHPILATVEAVDARLYRAADRQGGPTLVTGASTSGS
jgi:hypothetical protein